MCSCYTSDLPQVIFLTKIDKLCPNVDEDLTAVFRSAAVLDVVNKVADCFGLPRGHVFPVKNYENETDLDTNINILVLRALKQLLNFMDEYIEDMCEESREACMKEWIHFAFTMENHCTLILVLFCIHKRLLQI